jgi:hypothetical protein
MRIAKQRQKTKPDPLVELAMKMFNGTMLVELPLAGRSGSESKRPSSRNRGTPHGGIAPDISRDDQLGLGL